MKKPKRKAKVVRAWGMFVNGKPHMAWTNQELVASICEGWSTDGRRKIDMRPVEIREMVKK